MVQSGDVLLDGLRVNQLKLSRNLAGSLQVSDKEVHMHAKVTHPHHPTLVLLDGCLSDQEH